MKICVLIVTYNRKVKLQKALESFENQSRIPDSMIIVNNASTDGTYELLEEWKNKESSITKIVIHNSTNTGGSGGFSYGVEKSLELDYDYIWLQDDDAYPQVDALEEIERFTREYKGEYFSALTANSIGDGGPIVRRYWKNRFLHKTLEYCSEDVQDKKFFEVGDLSFVGAIIHKKAIEKIGIPEGGYFIYNDDTEYCLRLSKVGKILCVPSIKVTHDCDLPNGQVSWKRYYQMRNKYDIYRKHFSKLYYFYSINSLLLRLRVKKMVHHYENLSVLNLEIASLVDCKKHKSGMHELYKPGWKATV